MVSFQNILITCLALALSVVTQSTVVGVSDEIESLYTRSIVLHSDANGITPDTGLDVFFGKGQFPGIIGNMKTLKEVLVEATGQLKDIKPAPEGEDMDKIFEFVPEVIMTHVSQSRSLLTWP
jgi:hypothetical protein